jgi:pre-mRNA-splicing helicase BRR2
MAEKNLRNNDQFSYAAMSSLVINQKRRGRPRNEPETTGEALSLRNSALVMGDRATTKTKDGLSQLDNLRRARDQAQKKLRQNGGGALSGTHLSSASQRGKKRRTNGSFYGGTGAGTGAAATTAAAETTFMSTTHGNAGALSSVATYKPRTVETRQAYEDLLAFVASLLPEGTSEHLLHEFSEQALVVLKSDDYINRREGELAELFNVKELGADHYNTLTSMGRKLIDFDMNTDDVSARDQRRVEDVSVFLSKGGDVEEQEEGNSEDEDGDGIEYGGSAGKMGFEVQDGRDTSSDEEDDPLGLGEDDDDDGDEAMVGGGPSTEGLLLSSTSTVGGPSTAETASATGVPLHLNVRDVDAYWLQRKLSSFYSDATMSQSIEGQVCGEEEKEEEETCWVG